MHYAVVVAGEYRASKIDDYTFNDSYQRDELDEVYRDIFGDIVNTDNMIFDYRVIGSNSRWQWPFKLKARVDRYDKYGRVNEAGIYKRNPEKDPDESRCYQCIKGFIDTEDMIIPEIYIDEDGDLHDRDSQSPSIQQDIRKKEYLKWFNSLPDNMLITCVDTHL